MHFLKKKGGGVQLWVCLGCHHAMLVSNLNIVLIGVSHVQPGTVRTTILPFPLFWVRSNRAHWCVTHRDYTQFVFNNRQEQMMSRKSSNLCLVWAAATALSAVNLHLPRCIMLSTWYLYRLGQRLSTDISVWTKQIQIILLDLLSGAFRCIWSRSKCTVKVTIMHINEIYKRIL